MLLQQEFGWLETKCYCSFLGLLSNLISLVLITTKCQIGLWKKMIWTSKACSEIHMCMYYLQKGILRQIECIMQIMEWFGSENKIDKASGKRTAKKLLQLGNNIYFKEYIYLVQTAWYITFANYVNSCINTIANCHIF